MLQALFSSQCLNAEISVSTATEAGGSTSVPLWLAVLASFGAMVFMMILCIVCGQLAGCVCSDQNMCPNTSMDVAVRSLPFLIG